MLSSKLIHVVTLTTFHSYLKLNNVPLYVNNNFLYSFIHLFLDTDSLCTHFFDIHLWVYQCLIWLWICQKYIMSHYNAIVTFLSGLECSRKGCQERHMGSRAWLQGRFAYSISIDKLQHIKIAFTFFQPLLLL